MKIRSISIKNFRIFDEVTVLFDDYAALVGENGAGKSTILAALNVFFRESQDSAVDLTSLSEQDFHNKDTTRDIEITVTFDDLNEEAKQDFKSYVRQNQLTITAAASWNETTSKAEVKQYGQRLVMSDFKEYFEAEKSGKLVPELQLIYEKLSELHPEVKGPKTKSGMSARLREFEESNREMCTLERSQDNFYGFTKGSDRLKRYLNWVYVPAVKDASSESTEVRNSALGELLRVTVRSKINFDEEIQSLRDRTIAEYKHLLDKNQRTLEEVSKSISDRLSTLAHPSASAQLKWTAEESRSVVVNDPVAKIFATESGFSGDIARFGHGFQRCYIVSLLQELATTGLSTSPTLILGMEEPELYQHPPQARHLSDVLHSLASGNSQVMVTTHSPYFVSGYHFENVRLVRRANDSESSTVDAVSYEQVAEAIAKANNQTALQASAEQAKLHQALSSQLNEMFFCSKVVFVEGIEDEAILKAWMVCLNKWEMMREWRAHIIPVNNKSNLVRPAILAKLLALPCMVIFDSDGDEDHSLRRAWHESDNLAILSALDVDGVAFPEEAVFGECVVQWGTNFQSEIKREIESSVWDTAFGEARKALGNPSGNFQKNPILVGQLVAELHKAGIVPKVVEKLIEHLELFLKS